MRLKIVPVTIILSSLLLFADCGDKKVKPDNEESTTVAKVNVPEWFTNPPSDPNYLFSLAIGRSCSRLHALAIAKEEGRADMTRQARTKIVGMLKMLCEKMSVDKKAVFPPFEVSLFTTKEPKILKKIKVRNQLVLKEDTLYRAYVLIELPIGEVYKALLSKIKENKRLYTLFRTSQAFDKLKKKIEKYE